MVSSHPPFFITFSSKKILKISAHFYKAKSTEEMSWLENKPASSKDWTLITALIDNHTSHNVTTAALIAVHLYINYIFVLSATTQTLCLCRQAVRERKREGERAYVFKTILLFLFANCRQWRLMVSTESPIHLVSWCSRKMVQLSV